MGTRLTVILASNNAHKLAEMRRILPHITIVSPGDVVSEGAGFSVEENGATYMENAMLKARACWELTRGAYPVLADDSGIAVTALGGAPGLYSARYGSDAGVGAGDDQGRNALLLRELGARTSGSAGGEAGESGDRSAHYVCAAVLVCGEERFFTAQERWDGVIAPAPSAGRGGFGYDPIFIPRGLSCTVAEITDDEKDKLSHRGKAVRALAPLWG